MCYLEIVLTYGDILIKSLSGSQTQAGPEQRIALILGRFVDILLEKVLKQNSALPRDTARQLCGRIEALADPKRISLMQDRDTNKFYIPRFLLADKLYLSTTTLKYLIISDNSAGKLKLKEALWYFVFDNPHQEGSPDELQCLAKTPDYSPANLSWRANAVGQTGPESILPLLKSDHYTKDNERFSPQTKIALLGNKNYFIGQILQGISLDMSDEQIAELANALNNIKRFELTSKLGETGV